MIIFHPAFLLSFVAVSKNIFRRKNFGWRKIDQRLLFTLDTGRILYVGEEKNVFVKVERSFRSLR